MRIAEQSLFYNLKVIVSKQIDKLYVSDSVIKRSNMLSIGTPAPDFALYATPDHKIDLCGFKGKRVILAFYPADWSDVCCNQMVLYNELLPAFRKHNATLLEFLLTINSAMRLFVKKTTVLPAFRFRTKRCVIENIRSV